ncbi:MAG TPA: protein kinase [Gammaproteobacteria bacterium]|nr:protein kinase [Gammaproteobacteria bacterium]
MEENAIDLTIREDGVGDILAQAIPYKLGKYEIGEELGRGANGVVYKGFDPFVRRDVAIKIGWCDPATEDSKQRQAKLDFFAEAHAAGRLQHPNIVALYDAQMEKDLQYIVMEYVRGVTLKEYCRSDNLLPAAKVVECMFKCCLALDLSHSMGVIHRDIKPGNIMLSEDGETKLMDFSVAAITQNKTINSNLLVGSPSYMSPEQVQRQQVGPQSDLYSLGAVMYHLLTGKRLYASEEIVDIFRSIIKVQPPRLQDERPDLPPALWNVVDRALQKDPSKRFESGKAMAAELASIHDNLAHVEHSISQSEQHHALLKLKFFSRFDTSNLDEIMTVSTLLNFKQGERISQESDIGNSFYIVVKGTVRVTQAAQLLVILNRGECFGKTGFTTPGKQGPVLTAESGVLLLKVNAVGIETLSERTQLQYYRAFSQNLIDRLASSRAS